MPGPLPVLAVLAIMGLASCGGDGGPNPLPELPCGGDATAAAKDNTAPVLLSIAAPDVLVSGSEPTLFSALVQDSDNIADVPAVLMNLKRQNQVAASRCLGDYTLEFQAVDRSNTASNLLTKNIFLENLAPILFDPEAPDTVQRQIGVPVQVRLSVVAPSF